MQCIDCYIFAKDITKKFIDNLLSMLYLLSTRILIFDIDFCTLDEVGVCEL